MALGFLKDVVGLISTGVGIYQGLKGQDAPAGTDELLAAAARSAKFADALNPNSELFQQIAAEEDAESRRNLVEGLRFLTTEQNRATGRGMRGILNPERRDEAIAQVTARGFQTSKEESRQKARDFLTRAAQANIGAAGAFQPAIDTGLALGQSNRADFLNAINAATSGVNKAIDVFGGPITSTAQGRADASVGSRRIPSPDFFNQPFVS
ncbi:MAG: hypothetical protein J3T61_00160 [Candidatus Brocadiales bacterium]|nr:hypothetical protein [Candidatus Bathyanammoxibius sp.]